MTSVVDLAKLANAVYDDVLSVGEWSRVGQPFTEHASTFKAALYQNRQTTDFSLAIAGTKALGDLVGIKVETELAEEGTVQAFAGIRLRLDLKYDFLVRQACQIKLSL